MKADKDASGSRFANARAAGHAPDSVAGMDAAEAHRQFISQWFYDCTIEVHRGLGQMYVADPRFTAHYENTAVGLAEYINAAIQANADRPSA